MGGWQLDCWSSTWLTSSDWKTNQRYLNISTSPINIRLCTSSILHFILLPPFSGLLCYGELLSLFLLLPRCIVFPFAFSNIGDERNIRARKETGTCTVQRCRYKENNIRHMLALLNEIYKILIKRDIKGPVCACSYCRWGVCVLGGTSSPHHLTRTPPSERETQRGTSERLLDTSLDG